ncbi:MAG: hypothetical protein R3C44_20880 [Chloroflexota bacterium]
MANTDDPVPGQVGSLQEFVEWDGKALHTRMVPVFSEAERQRLVEQNQMYRDLAASWDYYHSNGQPVQQDVEGIDTEYGRVTVEMTAHDDTTVNPETSSISVEVSEVETPYGTITIEQRSCCE